MDEILRALISIVCCGGLFGVFCGLPCAYLLSVGFLVTNPQLKARRKRKLREYLDLK